MAQWLEWVGWARGHWFNLAQTAGIVGSLLLTTLALRRETRARKLSDLLTLAGQHRELWSETHRRPELARVAQAEVDLLAAPMTLAEEEFLHLAIVHYYTGFLLAKNNTLLTLKTLAADARDFFSLPLPRQIWERSKHSRDPRFVRFIEESISHERLKRL